MTSIQPEPQASTSSSARALSILGFVFGGIAVLFLPILFGPAGIVCGAVAIGKGDRLGRWSLAVAIIGMVVGMVLGAVVFAANN